MRLLNTFTGLFEWIDDPTKVRYAILSHTWSSKGEQSYQDVIKLQEAARVREAAATEDQGAVINASLLQGGSVHALGVADATEFNSFPEISTSPARQIAAKTDTADDAESKRDDLRGTSEVAATQGDHVAQISSALPADTSAAGNVDFASAPDSPSTPQIHPRIASFFSDPALSPKIKDACKTARDRGYRFIWIDSCCIDKASSAELSEAINSMFLWYTLADVCFVYMEDVPSSPDGPHTGEDSAFWRSRWHTRGWTLQELIAPAYVLFLAADWSAIGSKTGLASTLAEKTGVDAAVLVHMVPLRRVSVADRMRWASARETTRLEDEAYCLMGIFGVHMPTIYGEGRKAFIRLQHEIVNTIPDQSLFAWGLGVLFPDGSDLVQPNMIPLRDRQTDNVLLAGCPKDYIYMPRTVSIGYKDFRSLIGIPQAPSPSVDVLSSAKCSFTAYGAHIRLPCIDLAALPDIRSNLFLKTSAYNEELGPCGCETRPVRWLALLACSTAKGNIYALPLRQSETERDGPRLEVGFHGPRPMPWCMLNRMVCIPRKTLRSLRPHISMQKLCIQAYQADADDEHYHDLKQELLDSDSAKRFETTASVRIAYAAGCVDTLQRQGFVLSPMTPTRLDGTLFTATISDSKSPQCMHLYLTTGGYYGGSTEILLQLRHFFGDRLLADSERPAFGEPQSAQELWSGVPVKVQLLLDHPEEVDVWRPPGPDSPERWARPHSEPVREVGGVVELDLMGQIFSSSKGCLYAEALPCANRPGTETGHFKIRLLRISSRPVDYGSLHAGAHPDSKEECEGLLVFSLTVELSEPLDLPRLELPMADGEETEGEDSGRHAGEEEPQGRERPFEHEDEDDELSIFNHNNR
ncbi:hypothetical protein BV20DRAFT_1056937 [Pilatotrama ljubarskyi]|nr:hypothetical protein BV20DRAFT_1056937 [Pilatotrama ljubarskyi]